MITGFLLSGMKRILMKFSESLKKNKDYKIVKKEGHKYVIVKGRGRYRGTKKIYLKTK